MNWCEDSDFDPYLAALDEDYFQSYTGCKDPECEVHGKPPGNRLRSQRLPLLTLLTSDSRKPPIRDRPITFVIPFACLVNSLLTRH